MAIRTQASANSVRSDSRTASAAATTNRFVNCSARSNAAERRGHTERGRGYPLCRTAQPFQGPCLFLDQVTRTGGG